VAALLSARLLNGGKAKSFQILLSYLIQSQCRHTLTDGGREYYDVMRWKGFWLEKDTSPLPNWLRFDIYLQANSTCITVITTTQVLLPQLLTTLLPYFLLTAALLRLLGITCNKLIFPSLRTFKLPTVNRAQVCRLTTSEHTATTHVSALELLRRESEIAYIVCARVRDRDRPRGGLWLCTYYVCISILSRSSF
jgi:hypothetical protein